MPVATIKFYLREGLLHPGVPTARNQADYDDSHLSRIRLIRVFTTIASLSLSSVRTVLAAVDDETVPVPQLCRTVHDALWASQPALADPIGFECAREQVERQIHKLDWQVDKKSPGLDQLAQVMGAYRRLGWDGDDDILNFYVTLAKRLAARDLEAASPQDGQVDRAAVAARLVLLDVAFTALRRLAREDLLGLGCHRDPPAEQGG